LIALLVCINEEHMKSNPSRKETNLSLTEERRTNQTLKQKERARETKGTKPISHILQFPIIVCMVCTASRIPSKRQPHQARG